MPRAEKMAVAVLDILAFKALLRSEGPESIFNRVMSPLPSLVANASIVGEVESGVPAKVRTLSVSDTIVMFRGIEWEYLALAGRSQISAAACVRAVGAAAAELIKRGLRQSPPVLFRGAIAFGDCLIQTDTEPYCYLGAAIVDAYELEQAQNWVGAALAPSAAVLVADQVENLLLFLEYPAPLKSEYRSRIAAPTLAVNWLSTGFTAESISRAFGPEGTHDDVESKRRNTLAFYESFRELAGPPPEVTYGRSGR